MLPVFPKARQAMRDVFGESVFQGLWAAHPVLKELRVRPVTEGKESSYQREDGKVVETDYKLSRVEKSWKFEDATGLTPESFMSAAADMGKEMGNQILRGLLATVSDATEEVGNVKEEKRKKNGVASKHLTFG